MKKILALILVLVTMLSLVACGGGDKEATSAETEIENTVESNENVKVPETEETEDKATDKKTEDKKDTEDAKKPQTTKPSDKTQTTKPAEKPAETPVEKPAETPAEKPVEKPVDTTPKTAGNILLDDFKAKAGSYSSALSLAEAVSQNSIIPFAPVAMAVEEGYLAGFDAEITGFKEGATFAPMIGSIPFVGYVFILENGADTSKFISTLKQNANLRWNICVEAEEMVAGSAGNKVFFVMSNKSFEE